MGKGNDMSNIKGEEKHTVSARQPSRDGRERDSKMKGQT